MVEAREGGWGGVGVGWCMSTGGVQVGGGGGATSLRTKRPEWAVRADPSSRTAPRQGRSFRQGHRLEQVAQGGPVDHLGALATAPR